MLGTMMSSSARSASVIGEPSAAEWHARDSGRVIDDSIPGVLAAVTRPLDRVAVWSRNSVEWVLLEYACAIARLVLVPYNPAWTDAEAGHATQLAEPALIFAGPDSLGRPLAERAAALPCGPPAQELGRLLAWTGQTGARVIIGYGQSECPIITMQQHRAVLAHRVQQHRPLAFGHGLPENLDAFRL
jgi:long-subunit acyl-CoA synthetase (AMP-forming)